MTYIPEKYLVTAGGRIICIRCKAFLKKHGRQCLRPAIKGKTCCSKHGGKSTGPRTQAGIDRIRSAHLKTGNQTLAAKEQRSKQISTLQALEELGFAIGLMSGKKTKGPKGSGFKKIRSLDDIETFF